MPLPREVDEAVRPVLEDLAATANCEVIVADRVELQGTFPEHVREQLERIQERPGAAWITNSAGSPARGLLLPDGDLQLRIYWAADAIQEYVIEECNNVWPQCPAHPNHPLWAALVDGIGVWKCHSDESLVVPVGALRAR